MQLILLKLLAVAIRTYDLYHKEGNARGREGIARELTKSWNCVALRMMKKNWLLK